VVYCLFRFGVRYAMRDARLRRDAKRVTLLYRSNIARLRWSVRFLSSWNRYARWWFQARGYNDENTKEWWWNNYSTMVKSQWCDYKMLKKMSLFQHNTIAVLLSYHCIFTIVLLRFYRRAIAVSPSYNRCFKSVSSCFHHRTIAFSSTYHCVIPFLPSYHRERDTVCFSVCHQVKPINFLN
jgi:hypothetical protein